MNQQNWQNGGSTPGYPDAAPQAGHNAWAESDPYAQQYNQQYGQQYNQQYDQQPAPPAPPNRPNPTWVIAALACVAVLVVGGLVVLLTLDGPGKSDEIELAGSTQATSQAAAPDNEQPAQPQQGLPPAEGASQAPAPRDTRRPGTRTQSSAPAPATEPEPQSEPEPAPVPELSRPSGARLSVNLNADSADEVAAVQTLADHGDAINAGDYSTAFALFSSGMQNRMKGESTWAEGLATSYWDDLDVTSVSASGGSATVKVRLRTAQSAEFGDGQTCSVFTNTYTLSKAGSGWKISDVDGNGKSAC